jgi:hypothetical protein
MRSIRLTARSQLLHIEAPGCIVNIDPGLTDTDGHMVCRVDVNADGDRYKGDRQWWVEGEAGNRGMSFRIVQTNTPKPIVGPLKPVECEQVAALLDDLIEWQASVFGGSDAPAWEEAQRMRRVLRGVPETDAAGES